MPVALLAGLVLIAVALLAWILLRIRRNHALSIADGIALLGLVITLMVAVMPYALPGETQGTTAAAPTVTIEGPDIARLGEVTYFTIVSGGAERAEWSVDRFADNQVFTVDPLPPSHGVYVEPTNPGDVGQYHVLAVTVYAADGRTASASKRFIVLDQ